MTDFKLSMSRGDTRTIKVVATYPEAIPELNIAAGDPFPLDGKTVYFTAKARYTEPDDTSAVFKKVSGSGITVRSSPNNHIADVALLTADTEAHGGQTLACDCRVRDGANLFTVARGTLAISPNATRTTT